MSKRKAKEIFERSPFTWLEGHESIDQLLASENYWAENGFWDLNDDQVEPVEHFKSAFFLVSNPDHEEYENKFNNLEQNVGATSLGHGITQAGHIVPNGEAGRVVLLDCEMSVARLEELLSDVVFEVFQIL